MFDHMMYWHQQRQLHHVNTTSSSTCINHYNDCNNNNNNNSNNCNYNNNNSNNDCNDSHNHHNSNNNYDHNDQQPQWQWQPQRQPQHIPISRWSAPTIAIQWVGINGGLEMHLHLEPSWYVLFLLFSYWLCIQEQQWTPISCPSQTPTNTCMMSEGAQISASRAPSISFFFSVFISRFSFFFYLFFFFFLTIMIIFE